MRRQTVPDHVLEDLRHNGARHRCRLVESPEIGCGFQHPDRLRDVEIEVGGYPAIASCEKEGARLAIVAPKISGATTGSGKKLPADQALSGAPSSFFDAVALMPSQQGAGMLAKEAAAVDWLRDAFGHLKIIGHVAAAAPVFAKASVEPDADAGVIALDGSKGVAAFVKAARQHRIWEREPTLRSPG